MSRHRFFPATACGTGQSRICPIRLRRGRFPSVQPRTLRESGTGAGIILLVCLGVCLVFTPISVLAESEGNVVSGIAAFEAGRYHQAYNYLKPAAASGNATAQYYLALIYDHGYGIERNSEMALELLRKASDGGSSRATVALGYSYDKGIGVPVDDAKAAKLYRKAAKRGDPVAQTNLGLMYQYGEGVDFDALVAARWYERAATQGDPVAQTHLGQLTWMGTGNVSRDRRRALRLLRAAAEQDHAHGQYLYCANQTELYGPGSPELVDALKWCKLAADQGYPKGQRMWEAADRWFLSSEQKAQAEKRAAEWDRQHR